MLHLNENLTGEKLPVPCANVGEGSSDNADDVEAILLDHLQSGNRTALFPLGQLYYEQVTYHIYSFAVVVHNFAVNNANSFIVSSFASCIRPSCAFLVLLLMIAFTRWRHLCKIAHSRLWITTHLSTSKG